MTTQQDNSNNIFLTAKEQAACMQIANSEAPHSQRALALLALNEGNSHVQAAEKTGLSAGQVKYWVTRFRNNRLGIFPGDLVEQITTKADEKTATEMKKKSKSKASSKREEAAMTKSKDDKTEKKKANKKKGKKSEKKTEKSKKKNEKSKKDKKGKKKEKKSKK